MISLIIINTFIFFNVIFLISVLKKDFSLIDIGWGLSFVVIFLSGYFSTSEVVTVRQILVGLIVLVWALRLSGYIFLRAIKKKEEDFRYAQWRKDWGDRANLNAYFRVFILQMILSLIIASPVIFMFYQPEEIKFGTYLDYVGIVTFLVGFIIEATSDYQKNKFKSKPENKNKFCNIGLWKISRHPNYFGEVVIWWGIFLIIINSVPVYYAFIGPAFLNYLIVNISGVAMLEESYEKRAGFKEYKSKTNRFIPWFSKKECK